MLHFLCVVSTLAGYAAVAASLVYSAVALLRVALFRSKSPVPARFLPPITVLKPVCGLEPRLYENLRSFCAQDYPEFQYLFGVRDLNDPAIPVIERLIREFPERGAALVIDPRVIGSNYKISNLANMIGRARHDYLAISDADCKVGRSYLAEVAAVFADPKVGAATCLYRATPSGDRLADRLGAMFINEWFLPSVLVALMSEPLEYCFGATMAVRRTALEAIGGIEALACYLADDHMLGRLVAASGYRVALARHIVEITINEFEPEVALPPRAALGAHDARGAPAGLCLELRHRCAADCDAGGTCDRAALERAHSRRRGPRPARAHAFRGTGDVRKRRVLLAMARAVARCPDLRRPGCKLRGPQGRVATAEILRPIGRADGHL